MNEAGKLIVFEGIDGTGKSTQIQLLSQYLKQRDLTFVQLREPTDGPHGRELRRMAAEGRADVKRESELFVADRREDVQKNILPALRKGIHVLLDRYYFSTMAYQGARGLDPALIRAENEAFAPAPDLLILFDLPVSEALERVTRNRASGPDHFEKADYLKRVKAVFDQLDEPYILRIDARQPVQAISAIISTRVDEVLGIA